MKTTIVGVALVAGLLVAVVCGVRQWVAGQRQQTADRALAQAAQWTRAAQVAARLMVERYGPPQEISSFQLRWDAPSPWKRIVVQNEPRSPLEQVVAYQVPADRLESLRRFPHGLRLYLDEGALGAHSDRETLNRLSLNLAADIAAGRTPPEAANCFFVRTVRLRAAGKSSPYMERLLFKTEIDPDRSYP